MKETEKFVGGLVCGADWSVEFDVLVEDFEVSPKPCPHSYGEHCIEHGPCLDGSMYQNKAWYCPRALFITPGDPHHCAGVCLDCLLEKLAEMAVGKPVSPVRATN